MNLESLKRYWAGHGGTDVEAKDGEYVKYEDVEKLVKELQAGIYRPDVEEIKRLTVMIVKLEDENKRLREALEYLERLG